MGAILEMRKNDPERARAELAEDTVLEALFKAPVEPPSKQCAHTKRHHSIHTTNAGDEALAKYKERRQILSGLGSPRWMMR